jgi:hypothetical protein
MRKTILFALALALGAGTSASAGDPAALELMNEMHKNYYYAGDGGSAKVTMVLTDKKGRTRERAFWMLRTDIEDMGNQNYYTYFIKPADVRKTGFLVHKKAEGNDDRWLYIPSVDLVKRIAADDRRASFVGSDFTYEDVSGRLPSLDEHEFMATEERDGKTLTVVKSIPKEAKTADYAWRKTWIDPETKLPVQEEYYDDKDEAVRRFEVGKVLVIEGFATAVERIMTDLEKNHSTTISFDEVTYDVALKPDQYTERILKNPPAQVR